jgi:uncharacterized SAM-binding protein YcdF (DUF218 family)
MKKIILICMGGFLGLYVFSLGYIALHVFDNTAKKSDAIVILGAQSKYNTVVNPCLVERVKKGVALQHQGFAQKIVMSGGKDRFGEKSEAQIMKTLALEQGVSQDAIIVEDTSKNTYENLLFSKRILEKNHLTSVIIVSDPYHLPRASLIAKTEGLSYTVAPASSSPCWSKYGFLGIDYLREGFAILSYIVRGQISLL